MKLSICSTTLAVAMFSTASANPVAEPALPSVVGHFDAPIEGLRSNVTKRATGTFQAFSGNFCDGDIGGTVPIQVGGTCIRTAGRHSFRMSGCRGAVYFYEGPDCTKYTTGRLYEQGCYNVNTGKDWQSALASCER